MLPVDPVPAVISDWGQQNTQLCAYVYEGAGEGGKLCFHYKRDSLVPDAHPSYAENCAVWSLRGIERDGRWYPPEHSARVTRGQGTRNSGQTAELSFPAMQATLLAVNSFAFVTQCLQYLIRTQ